MTLESDDRQRERARSKDGWRLAIISMVAGFVALMVVARSSGPGARSIAMATVVLVVAVVAVLTIVGVSSHRRRRERRQTSLTNFREVTGFSVRATDEGVVKALFHDLPEIKSSGKIKSVIEGEIDGRRLIGFEHVHIIHTGSTAAPVYRSVFALETPPWPSLTVRRKSGLGAALRRMFGSRDLQFDLPEFNRRFRVTTHDPDFALVLLSPALQRHIMSKPSVIWRLMNGWLVLVYPGALRFDRAEASIARLRKFAELIPPELDAWQSSASSPRGE